MSNMSYCRFQNTLSDLYDCFEFNGEDLEENDNLSEEETAARLRILLLCRKVTEAHEDELEAHDAASRARAGL